MSEFTACKVKRKSYLDSVALMRASKQLAGLPGINEAAMMMGTPANIAILSNAKLLDARLVDAGPADLLIAIRGEDESAVNRAMQQADELLNAPRTAQAGATWQPKSIRSAKAERPAANMALISVPGAYAISEARKAIRRGLHVMIFSDNVPLQQEVELKQEARELGTLVMGPDCGTAIINGVALAFANKVPNGDIAIIGASGTGIQEISCLVAQHGKGISQAIGVGGRDLHEQVGGISTLMAMAALEKDDATSHIVLVSKPPASAIAERVLSAVSKSSKPYTVCFLGGTKPDLPSNCQWASTLDEAAALATNQTLVVRPSIASLPIEKQVGKQVQGLFCGGTLCTESIVLFKQQGISLSSNVTVPGIDYQAGTHQLIDLGADEYTRGKPHPMIEPSIRNTAMKTALANSEVGVLLVDMVLGYGAHADPAGQFIDGLNACENRNAVQVIASVTGTDADPQQRHQQIKQLESAGVLVVESNAVATHVAMSVISDG